MSFQADCLFLIRLLCLFAVSCKMDIDLGMVSYGSTGSRTLIPWLKAKCSTIKLWSRGAPAGNQTPITWYLQVTLISRIIPKPRALFIMLRVQWDRPDLNR